MEVATAAGGGGGPAPFLLKTYDMVDDSSTDDIVSWSSNKNSFVVWNPPEFARILLPTYFKHNNFSSFIRQLNTYGFRKIDPEKWEFANEEFVKDQKHLLKNIHRRKPIHSHSNPQGSLVDPERAAFDEEIERLSREKAALEADVIRSEKQRSTEKLQLEDLTQRVGGMEQRQEKLLTFLQKAIKNRTFVEHLTQKVESMDFSAYSKKRRLPRVDHCQQLSENSFLDNLSSSRPEFGNILHQDFSHKLSLEFSPSVSDINLVSHSTQSSNEDGGTPQINLSEGDPKDAQMMVECHLFAPETLELSDTGTSSKFGMGSSLLRKLADDEGPGLLSLQQSLETIEDNDCHISCHLNLTLASSPLQVNRNQSSARMPQADQEFGKLSGSRSNASGKEKDFPPENRNSADEVDAPKTNQGHAAPQVRVNDVFWEKFLTERPGCSDSEEASSSLRVKSYNVQEDKRLGHEMFRNEKSMDQLTL